MALEKTWRWFGRKDAVTLAELKQMGVEGVVTALHDIPAGEVWPLEEIRKVREEIEQYGMRWSVVESLPVSEGIKTCSADRPRLIANYIESLRNLGKEGIDTVCYNFMPVLDWARTDLHYKDSRGGESMLFDYATFAAFDIFLLKREEATKDYPEDIRKKAEQLVQSMTPEQQEELAHNIIVVTQAFIHGVLGNDSSNYIERFRAYLNTYKEIDSTKLREHLALFLHDVVPVAEASGVNLCIHPDDPPFPLLGLPRIASTQDDFRWILQQTDSPAHGITFCTGSLSGSRNNDIVAMVREFAPRVHFAHLRNTAHIEGGSFYESGHLSGNVDMFAVVKILLEEQIRREKSGRKDTRIPFRPDHGIRILDDYNRKSNPGYPLVGRLKGLAEIDGLQTGIERVLREGV